MANISYFFPERDKGFALGLNAAGGNVGVSSVQLLVPIVIGYAVLPASSGRKVHLENAGLLWLPLIGVAILGAWFAMDNLTSARASVREQFAVVSHRHTWILAFLYVGTFGSFVGFAAAFPLLLRTQFPEVTANLAFVGALVGAVARPIGGKLADRVGGASLTFWAFIAMAGAATVLLWAIEQHNVTFFLAAFLTLFVTTGLGNGSTFRMIPTIFRSLHENSAERTTKEPRADKLATARRETAAVIGLASAVGALGGYAVPRGLGASIKATGGPTLAISTFLGFYVICMLTTWWCYLRSSPMIKGSPGLAKAEA
jgi:NNP family nitrate/nitrite transporter-like MFS transporter